MEKMVYVLFLRHRWNYYGEEYFQDYLGGVFTTHEKASAEGKRMIGDFYHRFYVTRCELNKLI